MRAKLNEKEESSIKIVISCSLGISAISIAFSINKERVRGLEGCEIYGSDFESIYSEDCDLWLISPQYKNAVNNSKTICIPLKDWNTRGCIQVIQKYLTEKGES